MWVVAYNKVYFFFGPAQEIFQWHLPPTVERKIVSDFYWLKTPPAASIAPGARYTGTRLNGSRGQVTGPYHCADSSLAFFKEVGSSSVLRRRRFTFTVTSDEQTRLRSEPQLPAHGVNRRVPLGLESHFGPVRHEWLYRIAPKITETFKPYHDENAKAQEALCWTLPTVSPTQAAGFNKGLCLASGH